MQRFAKYFSPTLETSVYKGVPIGLLDEFRATVQAAGFKPYRIRFRGKSVPGYRRPQEHCPKRLAETFSVYPE